MRENDPSLYIGLISGTSIDAIDCALVNFQKGSFTLIDFINLEIPPSLKEQILSLCINTPNQVQILGETDFELGHLFATAALNILEKNKLKPEQIIAIGSHGQTIRHQPATPDSRKPSYSLQIGDPNIISAKTGITTIADFRRKDMAIGGQGAPLVPAFHREAFSSPNNDRIILNIGGMSNISYLAKNDTQIIGFDTGPGNVLMDIWIQQNKQQDYDNNGEWAASGSTNKELLENMLNDPYFKLPPPKSTGRELFNHCWLSQHLESFQHLKPEDIQSTLLDLSAISISKAIAPITSSGEIIVCGGGAKNTKLMSTLKKINNHFQISSSLQHNLDVDAVEAVAFAWLAKQAIEKRAVDYTKITGSSHPIIMGGIYYKENN